MQSLWGEDFKEEIPTKDLLSMVQTKDVKVETKIKSKKLSI